MARTRGIAAVLVAFAGVAVAARPAAQTPTQAPTFRTRVEVVQLDVSVLDKHRQPVRGLTEKDFTIFEDGRAQPVVGFSTFDMDDSPPPAVGWMRDVTPDVTTNELKESRLFVLVMDDAMIPQEPWMIAASKKIARSIIDKLTPEDLTAVVFTGDNRKTQDFTKDRTKLLAALDKFNPGLVSYRFGLTATGDGGVDTDLWFYQSSVRTLSNIATYLTAVPHRRKAVFWVSPGVPVDICGAKPQVPGRPPGPTPCGLPPPEMVELLQRQEEIFRIAQRANVTFYPIDPTGLDGLRSYLALRIGETPARVKVAAQQDFIVATAANTGGRTVMNINEFETGIKEVFAENSSYYLLAFEPTNMKIDGTLRRIQVKVNRPDVDVRTRSGYYAPEPEKPDKRKAAISPEAAALGKAMDGILPNGGMPLRVAVAPFAVPGQRLATVAIVLGVRQPVPASAANGRVTETTELQTSAFTPEGDPRGTQRHTAKVVLRAGAGGEAAYEVLARINLPAGRYQLRLAAHNATSGKDGSVFVDLTVPDYSNVPFSASPVVLSATPGRVSAPKDLLASVLPVVPTAERDFPTSAAVTAFLRLYQSGQKPVERVHLAIKIRDSQDQVRVSEARTITLEQFATAGQQVAASAPTVPAPRSVLDPTQSSDKFANLSLRTADVKYVLPLSKLLPGPHLLTFEATLGSTTVRRDVQFQIK